MRFQNTKHLLRRDLAILERVKRDIDRFTAPVFNTMFIAAVVYLVCFAWMEMFSSFERLHAFSILFDLSESVFVLVLPVIPLATLIEFYFRRRIAQASRCLEEVPIAEDPI